jgi:hypothetical protein
VPLLTGDLTLTLLTYAVQCKSNVLIRLLVLPRHEVGEREEYGCYQRRQRDLRPRTLAVQSAFPKLWHVPIAYTFLPGRARARFN